MKFKVFAEPKKEREQEIYFKLVEEGNSVFLVACDEDGDELPGTNILSIHSSGSIRLHSSVNTDIGLELDEHGRVVVKHY